MWEGERLQLAPTDLPSAAACSALSWDALDMSTEAGSHFLQPGALAGPCTTTRWRRAGRALNWLSLWPWVQSSRGACRTLTPEVQPSARCPSQSPAAGPLRAAQCRADVPMTDCASKTHSSLHARIRSTRPLLSMYYALNAVQDTGDKPNKQIALRTVKRDKANNYTWAEYYEELT